MNTDAIDADATQEVWRDIPGYEGMHQASSEGRIRSLVRQGRFRPYGGSILEQREDVWGYPVVCVRNAAGRKQTVKVSVLCCLAFHGPKPAPGRQSHAAHRDGVKKNNRFANLQWLTPKQNCADKHAHGTTARGEANGAAKLTAAQARAIYLASGTLTSIGRRFGIDRTMVRRIKDRKRWGHATAIVWAIAPTSDNDAAAGESEG